MAWVLLASMMLVGCGKPAAEPKALAPTAAVTPTNVVAPAPAAATLPPAVDLVQFTAGGLRIGQIPSREWIAARKPEPSQTAGSVACLTDLIKTPDGKVMLFYFLDGGALAGVRLVYDPACYSALVLSYTEKLGASPVYGGPDPASGVRSAVWQTTDGEFRLELGEGETGHGVLRSATMDDVYRKLREARTDALKGKL